MPRLRTSHVSALLTALAAAFLLILLLYYQHQVPNYALVEPRESDISNDARDRSQCKLYDVDPYNDLSKLFHHSEWLNCAFTEPLTRVHPKTSKVVLDRAQVIERDLTCWYRFFARDPSDENLNVYEDWQSFPVSGMVEMTMEQNFVKVSCSNFWGFEVYLNMHVFVPVFPSNHTSSPDKPSVLIILVESLSQHAFKRLMPQTKLQLDSMGAQSFEYFVKTHDNSFPNTFTLLTGLNQPENYTTVLFDDYEYLWNDFKRNGYVTGFIEDLTNYGIFNYDGQGFRQQPTDFYPHPFWNEMYPSWTDFNSIDKHMWFRKDFCFATNGRKVHLFIDQVTRFVQKNRQHPYFLLASYVQMTHEYLNNHQLLDEPIQALLKTIHANHNNTIVVLAGDHGFRKGFSLSNSVGRLEERMSLMSISIPDSVDDAYPHLRLMIEDNRRRLVSYPDIHLMMKNIATGAFQDPGLLPPSVAPGPVDPSREPINDNRTCAEAGIEDIYCVCDNIVAINMYGTWSTWFERLSGMNDDVYSMNAVVKRYVAEKCDPSFVAKSAQYRLPDGNVSVTNEHAVFDLQNPEGDIMRLNLYRSWVSGSPSIWSVSRNAKCKP